MSVAVRTRALRKTYQDGVRPVEVLRGVDLDVAPGELVAVVGPSGSGKSTLLHLLGALDRADFGEIEVGGQSLGDLFPSRLGIWYLLKELASGLRKRQLSRFREALARRRKSRVAASGLLLAAFRNSTIGFVFQFHQLLPDFTALENVVLPGRIAGLPARELTARALRLLDEVGLADRLDHFPSQLSGGERQRVALCRALVLEPPLLLADEPTGNLDPVSGEQVFDLLLELQARHGTTGILVTHNPEIAARCGRILRLQDGVLQPSEPA